MRADPSREGGFVEHAGGDIQHVPRRICLIGTQGKAVHCQKQADRQKPCPLVAIDERVVSGQRHAIASRKISRIWLPVVGKIGGPRQSRLEQAFVAQAGSSAVFGQALVMREFRDTFHQLAK